MSNKKFKVKINLNSLKETNKTKFENIAYSEVIQSRNFVNKIRQIEE